MSPSSNDRLVELTERILADECVSPECLLVMSRKLKFSVYTGGEAYVEANINKLKEEIQHKLAKVGSFAKDPEVKACAEEINAGMENMEVMEFMDASRMVCKLIDEYFAANGINTAKLEKKMYCTINKIREKEGQSPGGEFSMTKIKADLEKFLSGSDVYYILECLRRGEPRLLTAFGLRLPEDDGLNFFALMSDFFPGDSYFCVFMGKHAIKMGDKEKLMVAIERVRAFKHDIVFLPTLSSFARKSQNREVLADVKKLLEPHLHDLICLNEYALVAAELGDKEAMAKAAELLENSQFSLRGLSTYAKLAISLKDWHRLKCAAVMMEDELDDLIFLKLYTRIALIIGDKTILETAYAKLKDITTDPWFADRYGRIADILNDYEGMVRSQIILRQFLNDPKIRKTYDKLEFRIKDEIRNRQHDRLQQ